jgi:hypothetical protein
MMAAAPVRASFVPATQVAVASDDNHRPLIGAVVKNGDVLAKEGGPPAPWAQHQAAGNAVQVAVASELQFAEGVADLSTGQTFIHRYWQYFKIDFECW